MIKRNNKNEQRQTDIHKKTSALHTLIQILNSLYTHTQKKYIFHSWSRMKVKLTSTDLDQTGLKPDFLEQKKCSHLKHFHFFRPSHSVKSLSS